MRTKMKLSLLCHKSVVAASLPRIVLILLVSVVMYGCARVNLEGLPEAVEIAMRRAVLRHKAEVVDKVKDAVEVFAAAQVRQFNAAEQHYGHNMQFQGLPDPNPMILGALFKSKRHFLSYEIVDMKDTGSLLHNPYEVIVGYKYEVLETKREQSGDPTSASRVLENSDFRGTNEQGSLEFIYRFSADLEWDGKPGIRIWAPPVLAPLAQRSSVWPTEPEPEPGPPVQDLPVTITPMGSGSGAPPAFLLEGIRSSPLLKKLPSGKSSPD